MAQGKGSTAVADAPDTLPPDFFDKKQQTGTAPDTLPANFFDKKQSTDDGMYHGEEEPTPENNQAERVQKENFTPRMRALVASGAAKMQPQTQFEKDRPGEDISLKGAGSAFWDKLKQMVPPDPTGGHSIFSKEAWLGEGPTFDPAHSGIAQAGSEAAHEYERARKAGSGIIPSIATAGVVGAGSTLGASNKEEEEQAERGEGGKIIGSAAAPAAAAAVAPLVGPAMEVGARGLRAGLIRPIGGALADRFATPAVAPGLSEAATANLEEPIARRGIEKVLRSSGMPSGNTGLRESFTIAAPDLAEIEREQPLGKSGTKGGIIRPDMRLRQTVDNIDNRLDKLWKEERQPQIDRNAELPALSREQLLGDASIDQLKRIEKAFKMDIPDQINLGDADKMLVKVNARLRRAEGMTPEARALALELSPDLQKFNEMKGELHQAIGGLLERVNEPGIKEFNRRYGALSEVRDALRNKMNPVEAERVLDAVRATGGLGRNVNLFERLHLKASPGRLAQKGLEDLAQSGLQITPPEERPPVAGFLPQPPTPAGGPVETSGSVRGGRWTTAKGLLGEIPPIQGEYIPPETPQAGTQPPVIHPIEAPAGVQSPFRVEAPRMKSGTIPPIEAPSSSTILPGSAAVREMKLLPGAQVPKLETAPTANVPRGTIKPLEPLPNVKPIMPDVGTKRSEAIQELTQKISDLRNQDKVGSEEYNNAWELRSQLRNERRQASSAELDRILGNLKEGVRTIADKHYQETIPIQDRMEKALESLKSTSAPTEPEPVETKIKGITAEEPKAKGAKRTKAEPIEKRFSHSTILDAEGLLASEAGASLAGEKPGRYYDESEAGDVRLRSRGAQTKGGDWRGVKSGRNMFPFLRENPDISASMIEKALRNKDSAAYARLIEKAVDFNRRNNPAYDFLRSLGENPDAEPPEPVAEVAQPTPKPAKPTIPNIAKGETGIIPGMEQDVARQQAGAAKVAGENLTAEANKPKDISEAAGRMETRSPLFRGTEASPQKEIFGNRPTPEANAAPAPIQEAIEGTNWKYEGKNDLGLYTIQEPGTKIKLSLFERELNPDFIRRKIAEKEKQYGAPTKGKAKETGSEEIPF